MMEKITVLGTEISYYNYHEEDYISLTDMVKNIENGLVLIEKWLRNKNTIEFLGIWEEINNPSFNSPEFEGIKNQAGLNRFSLSVKQWVEKTGSTGLIAKAGRYGGTYAHKDIALFGMTAKEWRDNNKEKEGNIRDYANVSQLVCLSNLENFNALFISEGVSQDKRLMKLNQIAIHQMKLLTDSSVKRLGLKRGIRES